MINGIVESRRLYGNDTDKDIFSPFNAIAYLSLF